MTAAELPVAVPTADGELAGIVREPPGDRPAPGVVLVDGSGPGSKDGWGGWPTWIGDCGAFVLRHDKPGCNGSPGDWRRQSFDDRAAESLAAASVLRSWPGVARVGLLGISQGGWISLLAGANEPDAVDFVVTISGPGVSPARQERVRIERDLRRSGIEGTALEQALAWVDERAARLVAGESVDAILADQRKLEGREWYEIVTAHAYEDAETLSFVARVLDFDPVPVAARVRCPVLVLFGGDDPVVPVAESVAAFGSALPHLGEGSSGLAVLPGGDHGLFLSPPDPDVPRRDQLAPGVLPLLEAFLRENGSVSKRSG